MTYTRHHKVGGGEGIFSKDIKEEPLTQEPYSTTPVQVLSKAFRIDAGYDFNLAVLYDGAYAWGANQLDQLGDNSSEVYQSRPVLSNPLLTTRLFSAGGYHSSLTGRT